MTTSTLLSNLKRAFGALLLATILTLPAMALAGTELNINEPLTTVAVQDVKNETEIPRIMRTGKYNNQPVSDLTINSFDIKPNGEGGKFNLAFEMPFTAKEMYVRIVNEAGYDVYFQTLKNASGKYSQVVDLAGQPSGTYYLQVTYKGKVFVKKLVFG